MTCSDATLIFSRSDTPSLGLEVMEIRVASWEVELAMTFTKDMLCYIVDAGLGRQLGASQGESPGIRGTKYPELNPGGAILK